MELKQFYTNLPNNIELESNIITECPICHYHISPVHLDSKSINFEDEEQKIYSCFACPHCKNLFSTLTPITEAFPTSFGTIRCIARFDSRTSSLTPFKPSIPELPKNLKQDAFSKFQAVYKDTCAADSYGLFEVAGMGYRKCIEFLIKDFLLLTHPEKQEEICNPKTSLMSLINKLITDPELQEMAQKTTWLANDETHYTRIHTDTDLNYVRDFFFIVLDEVNRNLKIIDLKKIKKS